MKREELDDALPADESEIDMADSRDDLGLPWNVGVLMAVLVLEACVFDIGRW
jgi:hypothetical protein